MRADSPRDSLAGSLPLSGPRREGENAAFLPALHRPGAEDHRFHFCFRLLCKFLGFVPCRRDFCPALLDHVDKAPLNGKGRYRKLKLP